MIDSINFSNLCPDLAHVIVFFIEKIKQWD